MPSLGRAEHHTRRHHQDGRSVLTPDVARNRHGIGVAAIGSGRARADASHDEELVLGHDDELVVERGEPLHSPDCSRQHSAEGVVPLEPIPGNLNLAERPTASLVQDVGEDPPLVKSDRVARAWGEIRKRRSGLRRLVVQKLGAWVGRVVDGRRSRRCRERVQDFRDKVCPGQSVKQHTSCLGAVDDLPDRPKVLSQEQIRNLERRLVCGSNDGELRRPSRRRLVALAGAVEHLVDDDCLVDARCPWGSRGNRRNGYHDAVREQAERDFLDFGAVVPRQHAISDDGRLARLDWADRLRVVRCALQSRHAAVGDLDPLKCVVDTGFLHRNQT